MASHDPTHRPAKQRPPSLAPWRVTFDAAVQAELGYARFHGEDDGRPPRPAWMRCSSLRHQASTCSPRRHQRQRVAERSRGLPSICRPSATRTRASRPVFMSACHGRDHAAGRILGNHDDVFVLESSTPLPYRLQWPGRLPRPRADPTLAITLGLEGHAENGREYLRRIGQRPPGGRALSTRTTRTGLCRCPAKACRCEAPLHGPGPWMPVSRITRRSLRRCVRIQLDFDSLAAYHHAFERQVSHWAPVMPERFQVVQYESLVSDPVGQSAGVMSFCAGRAAGLRGYRANRNPVSTPAFAGQAAHQDRGIGHAAIRDQLAPWRRASQRDTRASETESKW